MRIEEDWSQCTFCSHVSFFPLSADITINNPNKLRKLASFHFEVCLCLFGLSSFLQVKKKEKVPYLLHFQISIALSITQLKKTKNTDLFSVPILFLWYFSFKKFQYLLFKKNSEVRIRFNFHLFRFCLFKQPSMRSGWKCKQPK